MEIALEIIGLLALIIPTAIVIYNRWFSKKAAEIKRRKAEDLAAEKLRAKNQAENRTEADAHDAQERAEKAWREKNDS